MDVLNRDCFEPPKSIEWFNKARGYSEIDGAGAFNGGIINPRREHLKVGNYYYRFVSAATKPEYKSGGVWWIDFDTLNAIYQRFKAAGPNPMAKQSRGPGAASRSTFREWLALTFEWNLIEEVVIGLLVARLDSFSGVGRTAEGSTHGFDNRAFGMAPHLSTMFTIKQHCVPEMWKHQKAAMPGPKILPFSRIEEIAAGRVG